MQPLVSIIIPFYNAEKHLEKTIQSAKTQTWPAIEIILINDGSTDGSLTIAKKFKSTQVKLYTQLNKGAGAARNLGVKKASGAFIQFLDADDLLSPTKIANQVNLLLQNPYKIAVCSTIHFFENENLDHALPSTYEDSFLFDTDKPADFLVNLYGGDNNRGSMIQTNAWLTPTSVIKKAGHWSEFYSPDDDGDYFCRAVLASEGIVYVPNCYNYYRKYKNRGSLAAGKTSESLNGKFESFLLKKHHLLEAVNNSKAKKALAHSAMDLAVEAFSVDKVLAGKILNVIAELGGTDYLPVLGGKLTELIKITIGWKTAVRIKQYRQKLLSN